MSYPPPEAFRVFADEPLDALLKQLDPSDPAARAAAIAGVADLCRTFREPARPYASPSRVPGEVEYLRTGGSLGETGIPGIFYTQFSAADLRPGIPPRELIVTPITSYPAYRDCDPDLVWGEALYRLAWMMGMTIESILRHLESCPEAATPAEVDFLEALGDAPDSGDLRIAIGGLLGCVAPDRALAIANRTQDPLYADFLLLMRKDRAWYEVMPRRFPEFLAARAADRLLADPEPEPEPEPDLDEGTVLFRMKEPGAADWRPREP